MTDYLGPLTLSASGGTYELMSWAASADAAAVEIRAVGVSAATLTAAVEALVAQLRVGNTYAHTFPGAASPMVYRIAGVSGISVDEDTGPLAYWAVVKATLQLTGYPAGAFTTLYSAQHVDSPASLSLATLLGTNPTALDVTVDDDAGTDMHSVYCALAPTAVSDAKWLVLASALTWTTMSSGTGATYWGNSNRYTTSATYQTAPLDTSAYPAGKYRLLARVAQEAGTGYIKDSQNDSAVAITRTTPHLLHVGDLDLPTADTPWGTAANLTISVKSDGTNDCFVNALLLIPLDYGFFSWHHETVTSEIDQLDVGPSGIFMDGVCDTTYLRGGVLVAGVLAAHVGTLVATASPTGNDWPSAWDKSASGVSADTSRFKLVGASKQAWYAATNAATPLIVPGAWYELSFTRDVDSYVAGNVTAGIVWQDIDGTTVRSDTLSTTAANDGSPTAVTVYGKAPQHAARARVLLATDGSGDVTAYFSAVVLRRCPLRLIVVAEDAAGALTSYLHPVHVTLKYVPRYEVSR